MFEKVFWLSVYLKKVLPSPWHWLVFQSTDYTVLFGYRGVFFLGGGRLLWLFIKLRTLVIQVDYIWPMWIIPGFCSYKGVYYTQGQTWSDGCDRNCRCEEPSKGLITCTNKWVFYGVWLKIMSSIHYSSSKIIKKRTRREEYDEDPWLICLIHMTIDIWIVSDNISVIFLVIVMYWNQRYK